MSEEKSIEELREYLSEYADKYMIGQEDYDFLRSIISELGELRKHKVDCVEFAAIQTAKNIKSQAKLEKAMRGLGSVVNEHKKRFCQPCNCSICKFVRSEEE